MARKVCVLKHKTHTMGAVASKITEKKADCTDCYHAGWKTCPNCGFYFAVFYEQGVRVLCSRRGNYL